jgi:hypothetical protein
VTAHGDGRDGREGKWRGNWRMEWVASTLHTTLEHDVSRITTITTADAHTSAASSRLNWRPRRFKWTRPFRRKTKSGFCACAITFQLASNTGAEVSQHSLLTSVLDGNEWSTARPVRFTQGKETQYPLSRRLGGSQNRSPRFGEQENLLSLPGFEARTVPPAVKYVYRLRCSRCQNKNK